MFCRAARTCFVVAMARLPSGSTIVRLLRASTPHSHPILPPPLDYLISIRTSGRPGKAVGPAIPHPSRRPRTFGAPRRAEIGRAQLQQAPRAGRYNDQGGPWGPQTKEVPKGMEMSDRRRKLLLTVLVVAMTVGVIGMLAGVGVLSAFSSTTSNDGNSFATGTVTIGDNDAGSAMYSVGNRKPNDSVQSCIKLTYTGTLAADVHLYTTSSFGALGQY